MWVARVSAIGLTAALCVLPICAPAAAADVSITATATIAAACSLTAGTGFGAANLGSSSSVTATATVNCNTRYRLKAQSANGGFKSATAAPAPSFTNQLAYTLNISVPLDNGGGTVAGSCASANLVAGSASCQMSPANTGLSSGSGTSTGQTASLSVSWTAPTSPRLIAGSYTDTITITIAAQP